MTFLIRLAASLLLAGLPFNIHSSNSTVTNGELIAVDDRQATLDVDGTEQTIAVDEIQKLTADQVLRTQRPDNSLLIELVDDSQIIVRQITLASGNVTLTPWSASGNSNTESKVADVITPRKGIASVQFGMPSEKMNSQWNEILTSEHQGDTLVIRKGGGALDYLEGVVLAADDQFVTFQYEGDEIPVKRSKLEGILFYQRAAGNDDALAEPALVATLQGGTRLRGQSMNVADDLVTITTVGGVTWTESLTALANVDYAIGRTLYLSDVEPAKVIVTPHIASKLDEELTQLLYKPRMNVGHNNRTLQLRDPSDTKDESYRKGLCLHSRTEISYRLNNAYRQFHTLAGIDPALGTRGAARLIISADGDTLWEQTIKGGQPAVVIDLDVKDKRRVTIVVDYEDKLDVADRVHLCDLRVTK